MRKVLLLSVALFAFQLGFSKERPITKEQLPLKIREFLDTNFKNKEISLAVYEKEIFDKDYKVVLEDGSKIEFSGKGEWTEIDCEHTRVPVTAIHKNIVAYVNKHFNNAYIVEIKREKNSFEVKLNSDIELTFKGDLDELKDVPHHQSRQVTID